MNGRFELRLPAASLILVIATLLAFWPVVTCDFTSWDDYETIARNPKLAWPLDRSLADFWTKPQMDLYVPVTYTTWALTATIAKQPPPASANAPPGAFVLNPRVFHGLNLALHLAAACVTLLLLRELVPNVLAALVGALVFALHPLQVETVAWASGTKDLLFAVLSLVALWQYIKFARLSALAKAVHEAIEPGEKWRMLGIATAAFVLAMLAKPTAVVTPLIAITLDWLVVGRSLKDVLKTAWPWLLLAIPCVIWTGRVQSAIHANAMAPALAMRPLIALDAVAFYVWKLVWPASLTFDYGRTPEVVMQMGSHRWIWIIPTALACVFAVIAWRKSKLPLAGAMVSAIVLLPVLGIVPFDFQAYSTVADHYVYLALLGVGLIAACTIARWPGGAVIAVIILLALGIRSFAQTRHWQDSDALFRNALAVNPNSFASYDNLAVAALNAGEVEKSIDLSRRAMAIRPHDAHAYLTLADAMRTKGEISSAVEAYRVAMKFDPTFAPAISNLAALLAQQDRVAEAIPLAKRAIELDPDSIDAQLNLGKMYYASNQLNEARRQMRVVLQLDPTNQAAQELLAEIDQVLGPSLAP